MALNAFKDGLTIFSQDIMNQLMTLQDFALIYEGTQRDAKAGSGTVEFDCTGYNHAIRFMTVGTTEIARAELELIKHGSGADLVLEVRSGMVPGSGEDGTLLKTITVPKEFIPLSRSYWSIIVKLTGLIAGAQYWLVVKKAGDAANHFHIHGETTQDGNYPCYYRAGTSGIWNLENSIHFKVFSGETGLPVHEVYGGNGHITFEYSSGLPSKEFLYLPPSDGSAGGIRCVLILNYSSGIIKNGVVS